MYSGKNIVFTAVIACSGAAIIAVLATRTLQMERKRNMHPTYHLALLHSPLPSTETTEWKQVLSCENSSDVLISINVDRHVFFDILLPMYQDKRRKHNYGSPYRLGLKHTG